MNISNNAIRWSVAGLAYMISGTASGADDAGTQVSKPFEITATCP